MMIAARPIATALALLALTGAAHGAQTADGKTQTAQLPFYVVVGGPQDLSELWRKIAVPDYMVVRPGQAGTGSDRTVSTGGGTAAPAWVVESVAVRGRVEADAAQLAVDFVIVKKTAEPVWAGLRLDDRRVATVREGDRDLPLRMTARRQWEVLLEGAGAHRVRVALSADVLSILSRKAISLAVPEAASTALDLEFPGDESDFVIGAGEDHGQTSLPKGRGKRLEARLSPRPRIEVSWSSGGDASETSAPVLTAEGDVAVEIDLDQMRVQSSWAVRSTRGVARELAFRLADDEQVDLARILDEPAEPALERSRSGGTLTIRLTEPLRPGAVKRVVLKTRRPLVGRRTRRVVFTGHALVSARRQTGAIGVAHGPNLWVSAGAARGLSRIDPQKLPIDLRARPDTALAFEFLDQPFQLELDVEPSPALYQASSTVYLAVEAERVVSETRIELDWARGRLDMVELEIAPGLEIESVGPENAVELANLSETAEEAKEGAKEGAKAGAGAGAGARRLKIRLTPGARDQKRVVLIVAARQRIAAAGPVKLGLVSAGRGPTRFALAAARSLLVELESDQLERLSEAEFPAAPPPGDWINRLARDPSLAPPIFAAGDGGRLALPLRIVRRPRELGQETLLSVHAGRLGLEVVQQTRLRVRHGVIQAIEIATPPEIGDRFEVIDQDVDHKDDLGRSAEGGWRYRLSFTHATTDQRSLSFRYRIAFDPPLEPSPRRASAPRIAILDASAAPMRVRLELDPELRFEGADRAWVRSSPEPADAGAPAAAAEFVEASAAAADHPFEFSVRAAATAPLPGLVVCRHLIRSVVWNGATSHRAWYQIEIHGPAVAFDLPPKARLIDARLDGRPTEQVEQEPATGRFRVRLPLESRGRPVLLEIGYETPGDARASAWSPPRLEADAAVLQSIWEIRLPWNQELLGAPEGWTDENDWYWDRFAWKRRPWKSSSDLLEWVAGAQSRVVLGDLEPAAAGDGDRYVFSMAGPPGELRATVLSRAVLIAVCSGSVLVAGFLIGFARIRFRLVWAGSAALGLLAAALARPSVVLLILQASLVGLALVILGVLIERMVERARRSAPSTVIRPRTIRPVSESSLDRAASVGSDLSTAIRVRTPSTLDHAPAAAPPDEYIS